MVKIWQKKKFMIPAPLLVGVELNPGPALTVTQRQKIIVLKQDAGLSIEKIAEKLNINVKTVRRWLERNKKGMSLTNLRGQGRKRKLTSRQEKQVRKRAKKGEDAPELARKLSRKGKKSISVTTVQRVLKRQGLKYLVREKREVITPTQSEKRLKFAHKHKNDDWKYVLFTDEKTFHVGKTPHKSWQDPNDKKIFKYKRHPKKINVWAGIGLHFKTKLHFFEQNLDTDLYCKILKSRLPPPFILT